MLSIQPGYVFSGTGDLHGIIYSNELWIQLTPRFTLAPLFQFTHHSTISSILDWRLVTSGLNAGVGFYYTPINEGKHCLGFGVSPIVRYQSSTIPSDYGWYLNNNNERIIFFEYDEPLKTWAIGVQGALVYTYSLTELLSIGTRVFLQHDNQGDVFTGLMATTNIRIGK